ncbi:MAG: phosphoglycerate mutase (2,3-diphosphoglycerate-independent) [Legionellales bacterium]|nr:phosphoglycerate mutase (2,3-diphosphoglycerate-independent) [Legionellales bacterium]
MNDFGPDMTSKNAVLLIILDGWGYSNNIEGNAIKQAKTLHWDRLTTQCPNTLITASGEHVGLPKDQAGNSEVGHIHIGAGRLIQQDLQRINTSIESGHFKTITQTQTLFRKIRKQGRTLHLIGLLSEGGVHSHINHLLALIEVANEAQCPTHIHAILDGRDTPPSSAKQDLINLERYIENKTYVKLTTLSGRFWAMDRDCRWERTQQAYNILTNPSPQTFNAIQALEQSYQHNLTDEFVNPVALNEAHPISSEDTVLCFNFRADRMHQLLQALGQERFDHFERPIQPIQSLYTMTPFPNSPPHTQALFKHEQHIMTLGEVLEMNQLKQLRIAETEKYAHVTFFMDGGQKANYSMMDTLLIPSPKVKTYDQTPEMSLKTLNQKLIEALQTSEYDLIIANFSNADMVGHTGKIAQTIEAIECIDQALGELIPIIQRTHTHCIITADHGNAESMGTPEHPITSHSNNLVPFVYVGPDEYRCASKKSLSDIAPTVLSLLDCPIPQAMTGKSILIPIS